MTAADTAPPVKPPAALARACSVSPLKSCPPRRRQRPRPAAPLTAPWRESARGCFLTHTTPRHVAQAEILATMLEMFDTAIDTAQEIPKIALPYTMEEAFQPVPPHFSPPPVWCVAVLAAALYI